MNRTLAWRGLRLGLPLTLLPLALLAACDVPAPPVEQLTPIVGSSTKTPVDPGVPTATAAPMTLPPTGRLWFLRGGHVWTAAPDGSGAHAASASAALSPPVPSPDGSKVAFLGDHKLLLLDVASGQEQALVVSDMSPDQRPAWSPNGRLVAYFTLAASPVGDEIAWSMPVAGGTPSRITSLHSPGERQGPTFERCIAWTPDMRRLAVSGETGPIQVIPLDVTAGNPQTVAGGEPSWSTDNRNLLYTETMNGAIALDDVVADDFQPYRNERRLVGVRLQDHAQAPLPRFNADASLILYRASSADGSPAVAVRLRADGSEQLFVPGNNGAWAPDGQWIVYETGTLRPSETGQEWQPTGLARVRADGSGQSPVLSDASWPAWGK
ncbi:MAG: hypothetical protein ACR2M0_00520 [Chloroflexia bacterium]